MRNWQKKPKWDHIYFGNWVHSGFDGMLEDFNLNPPVEADQIDVLLAVYDGNDLSGEAFVLFRQGANLFEVNAFHCSCYGLAGQWEPKETSLQALRYRMNEGKLGRMGESGDSYLEELTAVLLMIENPPRAGECAGCWERSERLFEPPLIRPDNWASVTQTNGRYKWVVPGAAYDGEVTFFKLWAYLRPHESPDGLICWQCWAGQVWPGLVKFLVNLPEGQTL